MPDALYVVGAFFASPPRLVSPRCFFAVTLYFSPPGPQVQNQPERSFTSAPILMPSFIMAGAMMFLAASDAPNAAAPFAKALLKRAVVVAYAPSAFMVSPGTVVGILNKKAVPTEYRKNNLRRRRGSLGKAVARGKQLTSAPRGVLFVCGRFIHWGVATAQASAKNAENARGATTVAPRALRSPGAITFTAPTPKLNILGEFSTGKQALPPCPRSSFSAEDCRHTVWSALSSSPFPFCTPSIPWLSCRSCRTSLRVN